MSLIELRDVQFSYGDRPVLKGLQLHVKRGERVVLLGVNGSGKSTLLKVLNGLLFPQKGQYIYSGKEVNQKTLRDRAFRRQFRKQVVLLFQNPEVMLFNPTLYDEVAFSLRQLGMNETEVREKVLYWVDRFELTPYLNKSPFELSTGQKQKLCLACLLVLEPEVLLLDEPTAHLDPRSTGWFVDLLWELSATTIISTHNLSLAGELGNRLIVLGDSEVLYDGGLDSFFKDKDLLFRAGLVHRHRGREDYHLHGIW